MYDKTMICVPIVEKDYESILESARNSIKAGADIIELRIDAMDHPTPDEVSNIIRDIKYPCIATNRMMGEGGLFKGSEAERTDILLAAAKYADFVDIELQTEEEYLNKIIKASKSTIISYHNFEKTPSVEILLEVVNQERTLGDIAKFAVMPKTISDTLIVLEVLSKVEKTIGISMGEMGRYTRVVAPLFGSPITFASFDNISAPGQLDIHTTRDFLDKLVI
ncbi:MAG: type I 3-dehydroquinate dehydratase [Methanobacterium sp.]|uniref:type I 3-dehydroquinate dehydratase n=1 Tax=Methanobacterium sp. TaxID=2164 RepID=UPI003C71E59E